jgi:hypothetical protein
VYGVYCIHLFCKLCCRAETVCQGAYSCKIVLARYSYDFIFCRITHTIENTSAIKKPAQTHLVIVPTPPEKLFTIATSLEARCCDLSDMHCDTATWKPDKEQRVLQMGPALLSKKWIRDGLFLPPESVCTTVGSRFGRS